MKKTTLAVGAAVALTLAAGGAALAQQVGERGPRGDADGDGRISRTEFIEARVSRLSAIDADRDGSVSVEERQSAIDTRRNQRLSSRFEKLDADGNGAITREEFTAGHEARAERPGRRQAGRRGGRGPNHAERMAARGPLSIAEVQTRAAEQFDRMDADRDGYVTTAERRTAREAMGDRRQERRAERMARRAAQPSPSAPASE